MNADSTLKHEQDWESAPDAELLMQFVRHRDEEAFRHLVVRHEGLVMGICRNILRSSHDAEDAFQATFLILARRSDSIRQLSSVAGWIQRVAFRTALRVAKRNAQNKELPLESEPEVSDNAFQAIREQETLRSFHEELSAIPERLRSALILCHLEGMSRHQAAEVLECTESALKARLARGRKMLRLRLVRRGIPLSVALAAISARHGQAEAATSVDLISKTVEVAREFGFGNVSPDSPNFTAKSITIANVGVRSMFVNSVVRPTVATLVAAGILTISFAVSQATGQADDSRKTRDQNTLIVETVSDSPVQLAQATLAASKPTVNSSEGNKINLGGQQDKVLLHQRQILKLRLNVAQERLRAAQLEAESLQAKDEAMAEKLRKEADVIKANAVVLEHHLEVSEFEFQLKRLHDESGWDETTNSSLDREEAIIKNQMDRLSRPARIKPGTRLRIDVLGPNAGQQKINGFYMVELSGKVPLGVAYGRVSIAGLTLEEAEKAIIESLKGKLKNPRVQVTFPSAISR